MVAVFIEVSGMTLLRDFGLFDDRGFKKVVKMLILPSAMMK